MIKNWKTFNESMSDNLLEVLITLEEIQKTLRRSRNPISIQSNDDDITFEYHCGAVYSDNIGGKLNKGDHYEKVKVSENGGLFLEWLEVLDETFPHYTPEKLSFNSVEDLNQFLKERYLDNKWEIEKVRKGRYFTNDVISDVPEKMR
jgi:hypothetical protein